MPLLPPPPPPPPPQAASKVAAIKNTRPFRAHIAAVSFHHRSANPSCCAVLRLTSSHRRPCESEWFARPSTTFLYSTATDPERCVLERINRFTRRPGMQQSHN